MILAVISPTVSEWPRERRFPRSLAAESCYVAPSRWPDSAVLVYLSRHQQDFLFSAPRYVSAQSSVE
jgi:hypothetical protein